MLGTWPFHAAVLGARTTLRAFGALGNKWMSEIPETREEGFYWVVHGQNPPEIAYWERGEWWLCGEGRPWQPEAATVVSDRLVFRPRLSPVA